jgi:CheY-like chemotaxis protein
MSDMTNGDLEDGSGAGGPIASGPADALSALAGGLAHDLANVLSAVRMMVSLLEDSVAREREHSVLAAVDESAKRGVALLRQLVWLARGVEEEATLFQPKHLLSDLQRAARTLFPASVELACEFPPDLHLLRGNPLRVYRLLLDLCLAARQLLAAGGEITLAARNDELDSIAAARRRGLTAGPHVVLEVAVSAGGAAFPATAAVAVEASGGDCEVVPRPGGGQAFRVYLPAASDPSPEPVVPALEVQPAHGELILVAEGDRAVREAIAGVLEMHGYRTQTAADGAEAVAHFARDPQAVSAVVAATDLPYLDGLGLLRAVRHLRSQVPVVLTGGGELASARGQDDPASRAQAVLARPLNAAILLAALHEAMTEPPPPAQHVGEVNNPS